MIGGEFFKNIAADAARRLLLILIAAILSAVVIILLCAAMIVGLSHFVPIWASLLITAGLLLVIALIALVKASADDRKTLSSHPKRASTAAPSSESGSGDAAAKGANALDTGIFLGEAVSAAMKTHPKSTLGLALLGGVALGADPALRRDLINLLQGGRNKP
ncbi:hypothetical protein JCM17846_22480 [Iodidimonas nitroreducens]|uniref:Phage holin family protein n=1 Tax=Iodidimonas nitroreducens TaxID=1236968 RepID=A0A5A7NC73_9PROT|nr:phage holin family protein [Iodidimonas nitroreducens]GAK32542.1 hypothetical protein AQ1_00408 [alpha proteobacterium Q-1]GER04566.1 hypothetical protein JCM17846_22480 [Iodidimonas nitroreducens]